MNLLTRMPFALSQRVWRALRMYSAHLWTAFACLLPLASIDAQGPDVTVTPVGNPTWDLADFHLFSAPASSFEEFVATSEALLGSDIVNGIPTNPPYDTVFADGVTAAGFQDRTVFAVGETNENPNTVWFVFTVIPDGQTIGSSPDFASGPIIAKEFLPIQTSLQYLREGEVVYAIDLELGRVLSDDMLDGESRSFVVSAIPPSFWPAGTPLVGNFEVSASLMDTSGAGFTLTAPHTVVPEPSSLILVAIAVFAFSVSITFMRNRG